MKKRQPCKTYEESIKTRKKKKKKTNFKNTG
jgi:hypothetical protein